MTISKYDDGEEVVLRRSLKKEMELRHTLLQYFTTLQPVQVFKDELQSSFSCPFVELTEVSSTIVKHPQHESFNRGVSRTATNGRLIKTTCSPGATSDVVKSPFPSPSGAGCI